MSPVVTDLCDEIGLVHVLYRLIIDLQQTLHLGSILFEIERRISGGKYFREALQV